MTAASSSSSDVILLKPNAYMNVLGKNVRKALKAFSIPKEQIIVLHDDLEQKLGNYRVVKGTSFKGHNGLKSIAQECQGYKDFVRIGIGIGRPESRDQSAVSKYVLSNFSQQELQTLEREVFKTIFEKHLRQNSFEPEPI